ncbi:hypothetical protein HDU96_010670 [Phlyctochytrium bullatum]|nr:hypothetical protein HDU96_010670 [Phlyctochytrium bullatum]
MHPFWTSFPWQAILPQKASMKEIPLEFFTTFLIDGRRKRVKKLVLDVAPRSQHISAKTVAFILSSLSSSALECVILEISWDVIGERIVLSALRKHFKKLKRVLLSGPRLRGSLGGLSNDDLQLVALKDLASDRGAKLSAGGKSSSLTAGIASTPLRLTHLALDGFGHRGFDWRSLSELVKASAATLQTLSLAEVRGGIDLAQLSAMVPSLKSLCISFSHVGGAAYGKAGKKSAGPEEGLASKQDDGTKTPKTLFSDWMLRPHMFGDLSGFQSLESLTLQKHPYAGASATANTSRNRPASSGVPAPMISHLLLTLRHATKPVSLLGNQAFPAPAAPSRSSLRSLSVDLATAIDWLLEELCVSILHHKSLEVLSVRGLTEITQPFVEMLSQLPCLHTLEVPAALIPELASTSYELGGGGAGGWLGGLELTPLSG